MSTIAFIISWDSGIGTLSNFVDVHRIKVEDVLEAPSCQELLLVAKSYDDAVLLKKGLCELLSKHAIRIVIDPEADDA